MEKIPTIFDRDWNGDRSRVVDQPHPDCAWVFAGEGVATVKLDGTCCLARGGRLYKRRELKRDQPAPADFELAETDETTGKSVGWVPVGDGPDDRYHREAHAGRELPDGTYELVGPKIQGHAERAFDRHALVPHGSVVFGEEPPRTFEGLRRWLESRDVEGIVFHHPDGRMAKIKLRDFGLKRQVA